MHYCIEVAEEVDIRLMHNIVPVVALCLVLVGSALAESVNPHGEMLQECNVCHSVSGWTPLLSPLPFSHDSTIFPLAGRHTGVSCLSCHATLKFAETQGACASCHKDVHTGQFGNTCENCHTPNSWDERLAMQTQHAATRFPLVGRHAQLDCQACHVSGIMAGLETACVSCHIEDYEKTADPSHTMAGFSVSCESCHDTRISDWDVSEFAHTSSFPLAGGHANRNCSECHGSISFINAPTSCYDCHRDDFERTAEPNHSSLEFPQDCAQCHTTVNWESDFDHQASEFPLTGRHVETSCNECHASGRFAGLDASCWSCHMADYQITDTPDHEEIQLPHDCQSCHTAQSWDAYFEHNSDTDFELTGAHVQIGCKECHVNGVLQGTPTLCVDCHLGEFAGTTSPDHQATGIGTQCLECHTTEAWDQGFDHSNTDFPLTGQHVQASCQQCHVNGVFEGTPSQCIDCHLADYTGTEDPDHQATGIGTQCLECHTTEAWDQGFDHSNTDFP
ncbi:hypothetical protein HUU59_13270, partial [bacterium]|nr:hypothetical protein [bacterium]